MTDPVPRLTLLSRSGCHLCDGMRAALLARVARFHIAVDTVDIAGNATLEAEYGWDIPVLLAGEHEICRHFLDEKALRDWLSEQGLFL